MIKDKSTAEKIATLARQAEELLNQSVMYAKEHCPTDEVDKYQLAAATAAAEILMQVLNPIYQEHKDLAPEGYFD